MLDFNRFRFLTFDCYGTLIDWETGIFSALRPILDRHGKDVEDARLLELYGELEAQAEEGKFHPYHEVLQSVVHGLGRKLGFTPSLAEEQALSKSVASWKPWPDTVAALKKLHTKYKLAIISNVDDDLFAPTARRLQVKFDHVITAEQAQCYKPALGIFHKALDRIGVPAHEVLHVGQSIYHDIVPAKSLGMGTVWVNRPSARPGVGAVKAAFGAPDLEVREVAGLAAEIA
jgi:2-haloacid dehalogenase